MLAVICSGFVATRGTGSSSWRYIVSNRHGPVRTLEWHVGGHVLGKVAPMDHVAGPAGTPFPAAIYVYVVQVQLTVSEVGQPLGFGGQGHLVGVAFEAERKIVHVKRRVKRRRKRTLEQHFFVRTVGIVASGAVSRPHRSVKEFGFGKDRIHVRYDPPGLSRNGLVVAFEANFVHPVAEQLRSLRGMGRVAVGALVLLENRPVRNAGLFDALLDLLVTGKAHLVHWHFQLIGELACVRLMST